MGKQLSKKLMLFASEPAVYCPGCKYLHRFSVHKPNPANGAQWTWDGNMEKPTFNPSMLINQHYPPARCHSFVRNGQIQFLDDCFHELAGKTVELPDLPEWAIEDG